MSKLSRAAREKIAARAIRAAKQDAREYRHLSLNTLSDRPTAGHFAIKAEVTERRGAKLKNTYFRKIGETTF